MRTNCFQIVGDVVVPGLLWCQKQGFHYLAIGETSELPIKVSNPNAECRVMRAYPNCDYLVDDRHGFDGQIFAWTTRDLNFNGPYVPGINFWSGGEWHGMRPLNRLSLNPAETTPYGVRTEPFKVEVWALKFQQKLAVVDCHCGIRFLVPNEPVPLLYKPKPDEVAHYLREMFLSPKRSGWINANLRALERNSRP